MQIYSCRVVLKRQTNRHFKPNNNNDMNITHILESIIIILSNNCICIGHCYVAMSFKGLHHAGLCLKLNNFNPLAMEMDTEIAAHNLCKM